MKNLLLLITIIFLSSQAYAVDEVYQDLLEKHATSGHIPQQDVATQELEILKAKNSQNNLGKAVRGVASSNTHKPKSLKIVNPAIEISTK